MSFVEEIKNQKSIAWLIDPDKVNFEELTAKAESFVSKGLQYIFIGGSFVYDYVSLQKLLKHLKKFPVKTVLFPGSPMQLVEGADVLLFLSVISSRNPYFLIDAHVQAAPQVEKLAKQGTEIVPTGYLVYDSGKQTAVHYVTRHQGLPPDKTELSVYTVLAGKYLGLQVFYFDAGSGAETSVPTKIIESIRKKLPEVPIIVGGGIQDEAKIKELHRAGANLVVIGNAIEQADAEVFNNFR